MTVLDWQFTGKNSNGKREIGTAYALGGEDNRTWGEVVSLSFPTGTVLNRSETARLRNRLNDLLDAAPLERPLHPDIRLLHYYDTPIDGTIARRISDRLYLADDLEAEK